MGITTLEIILFGGFICMFIVFFVNNLIYLRKLRELLAYLRNNHESEIKEWNIPHQFSVSVVSPYRVSNLHKFLRSAEYFNDEKVKKLKKETKKYLVLGYALFVFLVLYFIVLFIVFKK